MKPIEQWFAVVLTKMVEMVPPSPHGMSNKELDTAGRELFGKKYVGTFPQDKMSNKKGYQIINVDMSGAPGSHWVALYCTEKTLYVYDSFGRPTKELLKWLTASAKRMKLKVVDAEYDAEQSHLQTICGQMCLSWLYTVEKKGIRQAIRI